MNAGSQSGSTTLKIEIRRKVANGLVIGLQIGAMTPIIANAAFPTTGLEAFVALAPTAAVEAKDPGKPDLEADKALGFIPTGCDPSGNGGSLPTSFQPTGSDPSGQPVIESPDIPLPDEERCLTREYLTEPFDDG
jgi:hypothetical protein